MTTAQPAKSSKVSHAHRVRLVGSFVETSAPVLALPGAGAALAAGKLAVRSRFAGRRWRMKRSSELTSALGSSCNLNPSEISPR